MYSLLSKLTIRLGISAATLLSCLMVGQVAQAQYTVTNDGTIVEMFYDEVMFCRATESAQGILVECRPDSCNPNSFGTKYVVNPYLDGNLNGQDGTIRSATASVNGVSIIFDGAIFDTDGGVVGNFSVDLDFVYNPGNQTVNGTGLMDVALDSPLITINDDLNLFKIASNRLRSVPLSTGGLGDTGDIGFAQIGFDDNDATPFRDDSSGFPDFVFDPIDDVTITAVDTADCISIDAIGDIRVFDGEEVSNKPAVEVVITDMDSRGVLGIKGNYDVLTATDPAAENVVITPQIGRTTTMDRIFEFAIAVNSSTTSNSPQSVTHVGTAGNDILRVDVTGQKNIVINTGPGNDQVNLVGTPSRDLNMRIATGAGNDIIRMQRVISRRTNFLAVIDTGTGVDQVYGSGTHPIWVYGGAGNDLIVGTNGADFLCGGLGNDTMRGSGGDDLMLGGLGDDKMYGGNGKDLMLGETGADRMFGDQGNDILDGGDQDDYLNGGGESDVLMGRDGRDFLETGLGSTFAFGGNHDDTLIAGSSSQSGSVTAFIAGGKGNDTINCREPTAKTFYNGGFGFEEIFFGQADPVLSRISYVPDLNDLLRTRQMFEDNASEITKTRFEELIQSALTRVMDAGLAPPDF